MKKYIDDNEIGLSFVKGRLYPADYEYRSHKFHIEYGICLIFDNYINNLPDIEKNFLNSVKILIYQLTLEFIEKI